MKFITFLTHTHTHLESYLIHHQGLATIMANNALFITSIYPAVLSIISPLMLQFWELHGVCHIPPPCKQNKTDQQTLLLMSQGRIASYLGFCEQDHGGTEAPGSRASEDDIVRALEAPAAWREEPRSQRFPRPRRGPCDAVELRG